MRFQAGILLALICASMARAASTDTAQPQSGAGAPFPVFLSDLPNPNDYTLFANGGWDGNWYVGFNTCWMQKVTVPEGNYRRAFIGARLGRMKNFQPPGKAPWEKKAIPGEIYVALSSTAAWSRGQSYFLTSTEDIPLEPDFENAVEGVSESRWFWTEVPMKLIKPGQDHYLALWSRTEKMNAVSSAPILAAGWGNKDVNSWVSHDIKGAPPSDPAKALATPVTVFEPAIALKLVPQSEVPPAGPKVSIVKIEDGKPRGRMPAPKVVWSAVEGESVERAWIEISTDGKAVWTRYGAYAWKSPYAFTLKMNEVPVGKNGKTWVRVLAAGFDESVGASAPADLFEQK